MQKILIASKNKWKINEILEILHDLPFEFVSLIDLWIKDDIEEIWLTYEENAKIKAEFFYKLTRLPTISDDSWIIVEALQWELWVKTRRWWAGENAGDHEWLAYFMNRMSVESNSNAHFFSTICYFDWNQSNFFNGTCKWILMKEVICPIAVWIPLSSIFIPEWFNKPYSLLWIEEKNKISHRWKAVLQLKEYLKTISNK